jgi:hypothetical protein
MTTKRRVTKRTRKKKAKPPLGGKRAGAGRPTIFPGKTVFFAARLTPHAHALVKNEADNRACTDSDAAEWLMRTGAGERPKDERETR